MGFDHVKLEKGMYRESGKTFTQGARVARPERNYRGTALEGTDAFQRQLKRFDIHAKGAYSDPVEKFFPHDGLERSVPGVYCARGQAGHGGKQCAAEDHGEHDEH